MTQIFISYRTADASAGVEQLYSILVDRFGHNDVFLDKTTFIPGSAWLPQIRSRIAEADLVVCVVGADWKAARRTADAQDFVVEELTLAKRLRKPIIPILLISDWSDLGSSLPSALSWLSQLHFQRFKPNGASEAKFLLNQIEEILGLPSGRGQSKPTIFSHATKLVTSLVRPIRAC